MDFSRMSREGYQAWLRDRPDTLAFDTETSGVEWFDRPFCVTIAWHRQDGGIEAHYFELDADQGELPNILLGTRTWVGHNIKFDLQKVLIQGIIPRESVYSTRIHDTQLVAHLLDEHRPKALKQLARELLNEETDEDAAVKEAKKLVKKEQGFRSESDIGYHLLPREVIVPYAIKDAEFTLRLFDVLYPKLKRYDDLQSLYAQELSLLLVLLDMEAHGIAVDVPYVDSTAKEYGTKILEAQNRIADIVGRPVGRTKEEFNPNSPKQLMEYLGLSATDKETLRGVDHPLARAVLELRSDTKMHGTYLLPILREVRDGIIHPNFRQNVRTGRMASGGAEA